MNIGILGLGLMGQQRARDVVRIPGHRLVAAFDHIPVKARTLADELGFEVESSLETLVRRPDLDVVIVSLPHFCARDAAVAALSKGKHVLCEKPLGITTTESAEIITTAARFKRLVTPGFNYRFYPGILEARRMVAAGAIGKAATLRLVLGHGGRLGYEQEWKTSKAQCGGGALLDPGIHLIDLVRFLLGELRFGTAWLRKMFWPIDVEDNALAIFEGENEIVTQVHASITEWKSCFRLELHGTDGYVNVSGRSRSYGRQVLRYGRRWGWSRNPPETETVIEFPSTDDSFLRELQAFLDSIAGEAQPLLANGEDGERALQIVERLYAAGDGQRVAL